MTHVAHPPKKGYRTLRLPLAESEYDRFLSDRAYAKVRLDERYEDFPESSVAPSASQTDLEKAYGIFASEAKALIVLAGKQGRCRLGPGYREYRWRASDSKCRACVVQPDHGDVVVAPCLDQHPESGQESLRGTWPRGANTRLDRLMRFLDRAFFNAHYFHGLPESAENRVRALALLWNVCPSSPQTVKKHGGQACPAERLNGKWYADNWLENLLVSGSMNGVQQNPQNPL